MNSLYGVADEKAIEFSTAVSGGIESHSAFYAAKAGVNEIYSSEASSYTVFAVLYSDNASVGFDQVEYKSGTMTGRIVKDDVQWGVLFLTEDSQVYDFIDIKR